MYSIPTMTLCGCTDFSLPRRLVYLLPRPLFFIFIFFIFLFGLESGRGTLHYMYIRMIIPKEVYWNDYVFKWIFRLRFYQACT